MRKRGSIDRSDRTENEENLTDAHLDCGRIEKMEDTMFNYLNDPAEGHATATGKCHPCNEKMGRRIIHLQRTKETMWHG